MGERKLRTLTNGSESRLGYGTFNRRGGLRDLKVERKSDVFAGPLIPISAPPAVVDSDGLRASDVPWIDDVREEEHLVVIICTEHIDIYQAKLKELRKLAVPYMTRDVRNCADMGGTVILTDKLSRFMLGDEGVARWPAGDDAVEGIDAFCLRIVYISSSVRGAEKNGRTASERKQRTYQCRSGSRWSAWENRGEHGAARHHCAVSI